MHPLVKEYFVMAQITEQIGAAVRREAIDEVRRLLSARGDCLGKIRELEKERIDEQVQKRISSIIGELSALDHRNMKGLAEQIRGLHIKKQELMVARRQLARLKAGYVRKRQKSARVCDCVF